MPAPPGNSYGTKLKDSEVRQLAYKQYCEHIARGKSKKSWCFDHPQLRCTWNTMEKYIKDDKEFDPLQKEIAESQGYAHWESVVEDSATGKNQKANTASLQMLMRNKFGWDKHENKTEESFPGFSIAYERLMLQLSQLQIESKQPMEEVIDTTTNQ